WQVSASLDDALFFQYPLAGSTSPSWQWCLLEPLRSSSSRPSPLPTAPFATSLFWLSQPQTSPVSSCSMNPPGPVSSHVQDLVLRQELRVTRLLTSGVESGLLTCFSLDRRPA